ncbi:MAG TPA: bifunctional riboflavin kinase/FAD synthetase [Ohtaekwangia sp.]|nr:bifunctional riboflavin kinase/FAD synthetase [Ohtaekwangia sp.]
MEVFRSAADFKSAVKTTVTIGTFDGVHLGHRKIIDRLLLEGEGVATILTFFPHPRMILNGPGSVTLLNTIDERIQLIADTGVQNLIIHPFDDAFSKLTADEFVRDILVGKLNAGKVVIGYDHRFGVNRTAGIDDLIQYGNKYGFTVEQIPAQEIEDVAISSTKIRTALVSGNLQLANSFLGYDYLLTGSVVKGKQLGRTIGYPTANIKIGEDYKLIPAHGVYLAWSMIDGEKRYGMMNIGNKPTVDGTTESIEIYFFDFQGDLYGKSIQLHLMERIRDERKFASVDELKEQLGRDEIFCREMIG